MDLLDRVCCSIFTFVLDSIAVTNNTYFLFRYVPLSISEKKKNNNGTSSTCTLEAST